MLALTLIGGSAFGADILYNGETVSVTWSMADGVDSKAVLSDRKTVMDYSWCCGSNIGVANTQTRNIFGKTVTVFYPKESQTTGEMDSGDYVEWSVTPYDALSFTPTQVKMDAFKIGTDAPVMNIYLIDSEGTFYEVAVNESMARNKDENAGKEERVFEVTNCPATSKTLTLRVYVAKCATTKTFGFANVSINGTVAGVSHYREEYAVNITSNNDAWGVVKSSKDYVVEENPVTLTAIPNRGYRFLGWADATGNYVSTLTEWTFVPDADINLTAVFEPLAIYQVSVKSNIEGAGVISVTTFEDGIYYEGDYIEISALPNVGYVFKNWSDDAEEWKRPGIVLGHDVDLTAIFEPVGNPSVYVFWPLAEDTDAETSGKVEPEFSVSDEMTNTGATVTYDGVAMRSFLPQEDGGSSYICFTLHTNNEKPFVLRSLELDAARVGTSFGEFSIVVNGTEVASNLYPGEFVAGEDHPHAHYYFNLGTSLEFRSDVDIRLHVSGLANDKKMAFGNIKVQGRYINEPSITDSQGVVYKLNEDGETYTASGYSANILADIVFPEFVAGDSPVIGIGLNAFDGCASLKSITIPASMTEVYPEGNNPFSNCANLSQIKVEEGNERFSSPDDCNAVVEGKELIIACNSTVIPSGVTELGKDAFEGTGIASVDIPSSIESVPDGAFATCGQLLEVIVHWPDPIGISEGTFAIATLVEGYLTVPDGSEQAYKQAEVWRDFYRYFEDKGFYWCVTSVEPNEVELIARPEGYCGDIVIPEVVSHNDVEYTVTSIASDAFQGSACLVSLYIANTVNKIGDNAFAGCTSLTTVHMSTSIKYIDGGWFSSCAALIAIEISEGVETIEANTFGTGTGDEGTEGDDNPIYYNDIISLTLPSTLKRIGEKAFFGCINLMTVTSNITELFAIADNTFADVTYQNATLIVPVGMKAVYESTPGWKNFKNIVEGSVTGLKAAISENGAAGDAYTLGGIKVHAGAAKGLYVKNGKKAIVGKH